MTKPAPYSPLKSTLVVNKTLNRSTQRGVSLLMALILVMLITSVMVGVALTGNYTMRRSGALTHLTQAHAYNRGVLAYAEKVLMLDRYQSQADSVNEDWALKMPPYPVDGGQVSGHINELSSRFNLATLHLDNPFEIAVFERLWEHLGYSRSQASTIIETVRTQQYFSVIGALIAAGLSDNELNQAAPYLTYLPSNAEKLNINLVSPPVFAAYLAIPLPRATEILSERRQQPLTDANALLAFANRHGIGQITTDSLKQTAPSVIELRFGVTSRYFQVVGTANIGEANHSMVATVERNKQRIKLLSKRFSQLPTE